MGKQWVGLDVGEALTSICVLGQSETPLLECSTGSTPHEIVQGLAPFGISEIEAVAMESGAQAHLERALKQLGYPIWVLNPRKTHLYLSIRQHKTDLNDARGLAEIARLGAARRLAVHMKSDEAQELRNQLVIRDRLIKIRTAARNSLRSMLRKYGSHATRIAKGKAVRGSVEAEFTKLEAQGSRGVTQRLQPLLNVVEALTSYTDYIDQQIDEAAKLNPITNRLMQIPGVGPICAVSFYTAIDDPDRFERATDVAAYLGLVPSVKQSGTRIQRARITRAGSAMTRSHLVLAAGVMISRAKQQSAIRDWGLGLKKRVGYGKARVALARKLAVLMLSIWKAQSDFKPYPQHS